jgi:hypothetical protein
VPPRPPAGVPADVGAALRHLLGRHGRAGADEAGRAGRQAYATVQEVLEASPGDMEATLLAAYIAFQARPRPPTQLSPQPAR